MEVQLLSQQPHHYIHPTKPGKVTFCGHPSDEDYAWNTNQYSEAGRLAMTKQYPVVYEWAGRNFSGYRRTFQAALQPPNPSIDALSQI